MARTKISHPTGWAEAERAWAGGLPLPPASVLREHRARVGDLLTALVPDPPQVHVMVIPGDPPIKGHSPRHTQAMARLVACLSTVRVDANVALAYMFVRSSHQRIDVDNITKAVLDCGSAAGTWDDDSQVTAIAGVMDLDHLHPHMVIALADHVDTDLKRGDAAKVRCETCGTEFVPAYVRRAVARWCSRECRTQYPVIRACLHCGKSYRRRGSYQKFCSVACRSEHSRIDYLCELCGGPRSGSRSRLCRACWISKKKGTQ